MKEKLNQDYSTPQSKRYEVQNRLPSFAGNVQKKLAASHVVLLGVGGLGCSALPLLAGAGIGKLTIIDGDEVELANLHRQIIFREEDIGKKKASVAKEFVAQRNSEIELHCQTTFLDKSGFTNALVGADLILDCTDDSLLSSQLNAWGMLNKVSILFANAIQHSGQIFACLTGQRNSNADLACYGCLWSETEHAADACNALGVLGTVPAAIGVAIADLTLRIISDPAFARQVDGTLYQYDFQFHRLLSYKSAKSRSCRACSSSANDSSRNILAVERFYSLSEAVSSGYEIVDLCGASERATSPFAIDATSLSLRNLQELEALEKLPVKICFVCSTGARAKYKAMQFVEARAEDGDFSRVAYIQS